MCTSTSIDPWHYLLKNLKNLVSFSKKTSSFPKKTVKFSKKNFCLRHYPLSFSIFFTNFANFLKVLKKPQNAFIVMNPEIIGSTHTKNKKMLGHNCRDSNVTPDSTTKCYLQNSVSCSNSRPIPVLRSNWIQLKFNPLESIDESYWMTLSDNAAACIQLAVEEMNGKALC